MHDELQVLLLQWGPRIDFHSKVSHDLSGSGISFKGIQAMRPATSGSELCCAARVSGNDMLNSPASRLYGVADAYDEGGWQRAGQSNDGVRELKL